MQAYGRYLIVEEEKETTRKTAGGLELSSKHTTDIKYVKGKVLSAGLDLKGVKDGDTVLYRQVAGHGVEIDDKFHTVITEGDIMMIL